jgi:hypothetical protein
LSIEDLRKYIKEWIFDCELRQLSNATVAGRRLFTEKLMWFLDRREYTQVGTPELKQFLHYLATGHQDEGGRWGNRWKIILVLPRGENDLKRIAASTRVIAVSMPNRERAEIADSRWPQWITTVDQIEKTTGYDFFSALPENVERLLEQKLDSGIAKKASRKAATSSNRSTSGSGDSRAAAPTVPPPTASPIYTPPTSQLGSAAPAYQPPVVEQQAPSASDSGQASVQVWVNTNSGIYHYPGTRWYGRTKNGGFMNESQALAQGHRAALNGQ